MFNKNKTTATLTRLVLCVFTLAPAASTQADTAAEMARKLQNPLANIKALMTDNAIGFNSGTEKGTSFGFQFQPVYAIDMPDKGYTFIPRAVIPVMGLEPGTDVPPVGAPTPPASNRAWGLGDSMLQFFFAPHTPAKWKWGVGPQLSLPTHTQSKFKGPDWGAGVAAVITGNITPDLAIAGLLGNHWSFDGKYNTATIQPMLFYNLPAVSGAYLAYNSVISADWEAGSDNTWTVPLGFTIGRTFDMGAGNGLDMSIGPYKNIVRPDGAADWTLRFGLSWVFP
jgi:hypothetical protein